MFLASAELPDQHDTMRIAVVEQKYVPVAPEGRNKRSADTEISEDCACT